jgi:heme-degrading monooxygenase HmoA
MYTVMNRLQCPPAYSTHLEQAFRHAGQMKDVPGFISFQFLRQDDAAADPALVRYLAVTLWESRQHFEAWTRSEAFSLAHGDAAESPVTTTLERYDVLV